MTSAAQPLKTYYWTGKPNFGDSINVELIKILSGRPVEFAKAGAADFFAIGSNMKFAARRAGIDRPFAVWTTGMMEPFDFTFPQHAHVAAVRGPMTAKGLGVENAVAYGDGGLLCEMKVPRQSAKGHKIGLVPHHRHLSHPFVGKILSENSDVFLVRVDHDDPWQTVAEIASCEVIVSSSLHGLIVADCYGIPNFFLAHNPNKQELPFKFQDYEASAGRKIGVVVPNDVGQAPMRASNSETGYFLQIEALKASAKDSFPREVVRDLG